MWHVYIDMTEALSTFDVVLATYEVLMDSKSNRKTISSLMNKFNWHRIVLDECQELKTSTSQIAKLCAKLNATYRWMVSGTPIINKLADLNGELNFLKVFPFCLSDKEDGFWKKKIGDPFKEKDENALLLLHSLIDVVMMRHSKSQTYIDGRSLVAMPPRTVEWRGFHIRNHSELYISSYLHEFAIDAFVNFMKQFNQSNPDVSSEVAEVNRLSRGSNYGQIKSLIGLISKAITHASAISLTQLDHLKRMLCTIKNVKFLQTNEGSLIKLMNAKDALTLLQMGGMGTGGGLNRDTKRILASTKYNAMETSLREKYENSTLKDLR